MCLKVTNSSILEGILNEEFELLKNIIKDKKTLQIFSQEKKITLDEINFLLINNGKNNLHFQVHAAIIKYMIKKILKEKEIEFDFYKYIHPEIENIIEISNLIDYDNQDVINLMEELHYDYLNSEYILQSMLVKKKSKINLKDKGAAYTPNQIAEDIVTKTCNTYFQKTKNENVKILDFGAGTGRFFFAALEYLEEKTKKSIEEIILENLFAIDSDPIAIAIITIKSCLKSNNFSKNFIKKLNSRLICKNMLHVNEQTKSETSEINYESTFPEVFKNNGFDIIISNPPYFILKGTGNKKTSAKLYEHQKDRIDEESNYFHQNKFYEKSIQGMLNYYRLSIECMMKISNKDASIGVICPATLFGDASASNLRKEILEKNQLVFIEYFPERSKIFEQISQATSIFILNKNKTTEKLELKNNTNGNTVYIDFKFISKIFPKLEIPFISKQEWEILKKITKFKKIKQISKIRNRRGELDLSMLYYCITKKNTGHMLLRGIDISENNIKASEEFVDIEKFFKVKSQEYQKNDYGKVRIAGQQISNIDAEKRLKFAKTKPNYILGNSCNYITVEKSLDIDWILSQLNSYMLNWRFKITSSNNHVNNYEIDDLPIIEKKPKEFTKKLTEIQRNILICKLFNLDLNETKIILKNYFKEIEITQEYKEMLN